MLRPLREWRFKGFTAADGLLIARDHGLECRAQRRVLQAWSAGMVLHAFDEAYLLLFPAPQRLRTETALGAVVCRQGTVLATLPLDPATLANLDPPAGALITLTRGQIRIVPREELVSISPAHWLAVSAYETRLLSDLGPAIHGAQERIHIAEGDVRSVLGTAIPAQDARTKNLLEQVRQQTTAKTTIRPISRDHGRPSDGASWFDTLAHWLGGFRGGLRASTRKGVPAHTGTKGAGGGMSMPGSNRGLSLLDRLQGLFAQAAARADVANLIGRRQARYLMDTLRLFEQNRIDEALKRAISLGTAGPTAARPALGVPSIRDSLRIRAKTPGQLLAMRLPGSVFQLFERTYRDQVQKLEAAGKFEQAAFILAELLEKNEEAVALLERAGLLKEAARVAEVRNLPPARAVRLWFLAGEREKAIKLAIRHNAFQDAVARMQSGHPEQAATLIRLWAEHLARAGDLRAAVWTALPRPELRDRVSEWIETALSAEGQTADSELTAELLALKLRLNRTAWPEQAEAVARIAEASGMLGRRSRLRFVRTSIDTSVGESQPMALRPVVRALLADLDHLPKESLTTVETALKRCDDRALLTDAELLLRDAAALRKQRKLSERPSLETVAIAAEDRGSRTPYDAAMLPGGQMLIALGEAGVLICGRQGCIQTRFACPAHRLVVSDSGTRAIALAQRGELWQLTRLDLLARTVHDWTQVPLQGFADSYDGALWLVLQNQALLAIDCTDEGFGYLWDVSNIDGEVIALNRDSHRACFLLRQSRSVEIWSIDLKTLRLEVWEPKLSAIPAANDWLAAGISPYRFVCSVAVNRETWDPDWGPPQQSGTQTRALPVSEQQSWRYRSEEEWSRLRPARPLRAVSNRPLANPADWTPQGAFRAIASASYFATICMRERDLDVPSSQQKQRREDYDIDLDVSQISPMNRLLRYQINGVNRTRIRFQDQVLCYCDDRGRVLAIRLDEPEEVINWRL